MRLTIIALAILPACSIPTDKMLHAGAGAGVAGIAISAGGTWQQSCLASIAAGVAKEAYDATGRGTPEAMDAIATGAAGCLAAWVTGR